MRRYDGEIAVVTAFACRSGARTKKVRTKFDSFPPSMAMADEPGELLLWFSVGLGIGRLGCWVGFWVVLMFHRKHWWRILRQKTRTKTINSLVALWFVETRD